MQKSKIKTSSSAKASKGKRNDSTVNSPSADSAASQGTGKIGREPTSMEELLAQTGYVLKSNKRGDIVEGRVLSATSKHIRLDIGGKGEAIVHEKEMPYIVDLARNLKTGDTVTVHVVNPENDRGQTVVSLRKTALHKRWEFLAEKVKSGEAVEVIVRELSRGGFLVDYQGLRGFIPLSQADSEFARLAERATGRRAQVKVIEVDRDANRLVFSQTGGVASEKQKAALKQVEIGKTYEAEVTGIAPFGAFVSVKVTRDTALPGLIHISEIAWEKVESAAAYMKIGQTVNVKVIGADPKIGKLTLSLKQLLADPWADVTKVFSVDQEVTGRVTRMSQYGAFVSLLPGIEGLIHISKISPGEEPKVGADIECTIEEINPDKRKVSLSLVSHAKPIGYR